MMRRLAILFAAICIVGFMASESNAQHHGGHGHHSGQGHCGGHSSYGHGGGFSISVGNGYSNFGYSSHRPAYGGYYGHSSYRPAYSAPVYRGGYYGGRGYYSAPRGSYYGGGYQRGCGSGGGIVIGW